MAHRDWEPDDFLDEFLEFDYRKPVPEERSGGASRGLPTEKTTEKAQQNNKNYGLEDDVRLYRAMRAHRDQDAGSGTPEQAGKVVRPTAGAMKADIPAPLSSRRASARQSYDADVSQTGSEQRTVDNADLPASGMEGKSVISSVLAGIKSKSSHIHASEVASDALNAARKLVASEEDIQPEEVPASDAGRYVANAAGLSSGGFGASSRLDSRDELAELFAELGETGNSSITADENAALKQAQQDAYDRYRGNYAKSFKKAGSPGKTGLLSKWLSRIYVVALAAFAIIMAVMNVLPFGMLIALYVVLGLLSVIIVAQLRRKNVRRWTKALASVTAVLLILVFGVGSAYAMGTLSFLDNTSVENANRVASVTKQPFNVCITGIDVDGTIDEEGRSDVNMVLTVNPLTHQILMTSIPRDYQIYMPDKDYAMDKLTHTGFYGVDTTIGAEESLFETKINYYVKVNFTTVEEFVDAIGGVDVYSEYEFTPVKLKSWTVQEGWNHMNGKQALAFARERKAFATGDNQRIKNQQAVFEAIIKKATSSRTMLMSYNKILSNLRDYFRMSFSSAELRSLLKMQLSKDPDWTIYKNTVVGGDGSLPTYSTGNAYAYVMVQDQQSIDNAKTLINAVLEGQLLDKDDDGNVYVASEDEAGESEGTED